MRVSGEATRMRIHVCECGRKWLLEKHHSITRDVDSLECRCGKEIIHWSGSTWYTRVQVFDNPVRVVLPLKTTRPVREFPVGTEIDVTPYLQTIGSRLDSLYCREIIVGGEHYLAAEGDVLAAAGDPWPVTPPLPG